MLDGDEGEFEKMKLHFEKEIAKVKRKEKIREMTSRAIDRSEEAFRRLAEED